MLGTGPLRGRLGVGPLHAALWPLRVDVPPAIDIVAARDGNCRVTAEGGAWCWGFDDLGQILGVPRSALEPSRVEGLVPFGTID